ncbi:OsmC family protein [Tenacibaculum aestuariivivum]|uniref:OsmC family protein n=1 Tax=Tenacibaculum aestuariivivum TaxID=2006131 RepID=UPI003AB5D651
MNYCIKALITSDKNAAIEIKQSNISFGIGLTTESELPNPAELFLGSLAACILKNIQRFSSMMKFTYSKAIIEVNGTRIENLPRIDNITYKVTIYSNDKKLNLALLKKNIEKFGTIYNTVKLSCSISGTINSVNNV